MIAVVIRQDHMRECVEDIQLIHGIPEDMRPTAVSLYDDAFGAKFAVAISSPQRRIALLENTLNLRFAFGAIANDQLVGVAGYKTDAGSLPTG